MLCVKEINFFFLISSNVTPKKPTERHTLTAFSVQYTSKQQIKGLAIN
jgi:hypothetical protein